MVIYLLAITIPDITEALSDANLFEEPRAGYVWKDYILEAREIFWKSLMGLIFQTCFFVSVALWSFNEAFEKDVGTSAMVSPKQRIETSASKFTSETYEKVVGQINYVKILKPLGIVLLLGGVGILVWTLLSMLGSVGVIDVPSSHGFSTGTLVFNLFLFSVSVIIGVALWTKGKEQKKDKMKPTQNFRQEYEEQKKREMEDRI